MCEYTNGVIMSIYTIRSAKIGFMLSFFIIGIISVYIWQSYSIEFAVTVGMALLSVSVYEYRRKQSDIRTAYSYENQ